jgi:hypothetical protein
MELPIPLDQKINLQARYELMKSIILNPDGTLNDLHINPSDTYSVYHAFADLLVEIDDYNYRLESQNL